MKLNLGISAMLVTAVLAGAAGGAVAMSAGAAPAPSAPVTLHQVAAEATAAPVEPTVTPAPVVDEPEPAPKPVVHVDRAPVSDPAPIVEPVATKTETASEAADRAKAEADRAKAEADRATQTKVAVPTPSPPAPPVVGPDLGGTTGNQQPLIQGLTVRPTAEPKPAATPVVDRG